jgi:hypothetical protein
VTATTPRLRGEYDNTAGTVQAAAIDAEEPRRLVLADAEVRKPRILRAFCGTPLLGLASSLRQQLACPSLRAPDASEPGRLTQSV